MALQHIEHGKALARQETKLVEKLDRSTMATNFQDLGIKTRTGISVPHYKNREHFIHAPETSDEEMNTPQISDRAEHGNHKKNKAKTSTTTAYDWQQRRAKAGSSLEIKPAYFNMEAKEIVSKMKNIIHPSMTMT